MTETRAEKAQRLVDEGRVRIVDSNQLFTIAQVKGDHDSYYVSVTSTGASFCVCPWGASHSYTDDLCAHALAVKLAVERMNEQCTPSEPT